MADLKTLKKTVLPTELPKDWDTMSAGLKKGHISRRRKKLNEADRHIRQLERELAASRTWRHRLLMYISQMENAL